MVRLGISVESVTERRFVTLVLEEHFIGHGIYITPVSIGGNVSISRVNSELNKLSRSFDYITTFYDFYGFKGKTQEDSKTSLEEDMVSGVNDFTRNKLVPYIQMHEFEGLLFSSPVAIANNVEGKDIECWSEKILQNFGGNPEEINDSPLTAPSKRLEQYTTYKKTIDGPNICKEIGLNNIRARCNGFNDWLVKLETLPHIAI